MNWTGGRLKQHSKKTRGKTAVDKQKAYFARARTKLQNAPRLASGSVSSFLHFEQHVPLSVRCSQHSDSCPKRQRLETFQGMAPPAKRLDLLADISKSQQNLGSTIHARSSSYRQNGINILDERHSPIHPDKLEHQSVLQHAKSILNSRDRFHKHLHSSLELGSKPAVSKALLRSSDKQRLVEVRKNLLTQPDWVGLNMSFPLHLDHISVQKEEEVGKRRKIDGLGRFRPRVLSAGRTRVPSVNEQYMMSGALFRKYDEVEEILKIRIGEGALASRSIRQPSNFPDTSDLDEDFSDSIMLEDEERHRGNQSFMLLDDDGSDEDVELERLKNVGIAKQTMEAGCLSTSRSVKDGNFRESQEVTSAIFHEVIPKHLNTIEAAESIENRTSHDNNVLQNYSSTTDRTSHKIKGYVYESPRSSSWSIESLVDGLCDHRTKTGVTNYESSASRRQGGDNNKLFESSAGKDDEAFRRQLVELPVDSAAKSLAIVVKEHEDSNEANSHCSWNGSPSSTDATVGQSNPTCFDEYSDRSDEKELPLLRKKPVVSNPALTIDARRKKVTVINPHYHEQHKDPIYIIPVDVSTESKNVTPPQSQPSILVSKTTTKPVLPKTLSQEQEELWRKFVFGDLVSKDSDVESEIDIRHTHAASPHLHGKTYDSSLYGNVSSADTSHNNTTSDSSFLSYLPATNSLASANSDIQTTAATLAPTSPLPSCSISTVSTTTETKLYPAQQPQSTSSFSRPSSLFNASTTAAVLRTQHARPHPVVQSSSDPITRDQVLFHHNQVDTRKWHGGNGAHSSTKERKKNQKRILFRRPTPFIGG